MGIIDNRQIWFSLPQKEITNVEDPTVFTDDFDTDLEYFTEENGQKNWKIENGCLSTTADKSGALTYMQVYEKNVTLKARFRYSNAIEGSHDSKITFMVRYNAPEAYVKLKYIPATGKWGLVSSEGADHFPYKYCEVGGAECAPNEWHEVELTLDGENGSFSVDGKHVATCERIHHISSGRVGFCAECVTLEIDKAEVTLLSGQGTIMRGVKHHKLPDDRYREGGSVFEMNDGSLTYFHGSGTTFTSKNNGEIWEREAEPWTQPFGYPNILRLQNGDWLKIAYHRGENGEGNYRYCQLSSDDGKTWRDGGRICPCPYVSERGATKAGSGNMNDKLSQFSNGRIYYSQNYDAYAANEMAYGLYWVFCVFYYSDDNGMTWHEAKSRSWDISGDIIRYGECKALECADGTHRIYNSWNQLGCMTYSESTDCGVTWSPMVLMEDYKCPSSSMQFCRDEYAEGKTTYYMVFVNSEERAPKMIMPRSRLSLMRSYDGKTWEFLGDVWRWDPHLVCGCDPCHIVDPFIKVTKDYVIVGSGISEEKWKPDRGENPTHHAQRQHIWSIKKKYLVGGELKTK